jgi:hypothetical protein
MKIGMLVVLAIVLWVVDLPPVDAAPVLLTDLITNHGSIQVGDKLFNNFFLNDFVNGSLITIEGISISGDNGLHINQPNVNVPAPGPPINIAVSFQVSVLGGGFLLHDYTQSFTSVPSGAGASIVFSTASGGLSLGEGTIETPSGPSSVHVDLRFVGGSSVGGSSVSVSLISFGSTSTFIGPQTGTLATDITFSQVPFQVPAVPEPSTWLLLGSGLAGMMLWRKRQSIVDSQ